MKRLVLNKKTGFATKDVKIEIYTPDGKPCYIVNNYKGLHEFNLPKGEYLTDNNLMKLYSPVIFDIPKMPTPNRHVPIPKTGLKIFYRNNPNKASINCKAGILIFDHAIRELPKFQQDFIKFHEIAHQYYGGYNYKTQPKEYMQAEINCDTFAAICMLLKGYNPTQSYLTVKHSLSLPERIAASNNFNRKIKYAEDINR